MAAIKAWLWAAPYVVAALFLGGMLWYRGQSIDAAAKQATAEAQLALAVEANKQQAETIKRITVLRAQTDRTIAEYTDKLNALTASADSITEAIQGMERANVDVKAYLATPVPADIARVLNAKAH